MRKRAIVAIIVLAICLTIVLIGAPFFSYFVSVLLGGNLHHELHGDGILYMYSDTGNASAPLWKFILILFIPIAFTYALVFLLLELRYRSKERNLIGIVGAIMAFISLALPWWTITIDNSPVVYGGTSYSISIYTYQTTAINTNFGLSIHLGISIWYAWVALVLIVLGGLLGVAGSLVRNARRMVAAGGLFALLSTIIFAAGLQIELSRAPVFSDVSVGSTRVGLFSSGIVSTGGFYYITYLSFGFWLALVAAIIMLATSLTKHKMKMGTTPPNTHRPTPT